MVCSICQDEGIMSQYLRKLGLDHRLTLISLIGTTGNTSLLNGATEEEKEAIFVVAAGAGQLTLVKLLYEEGVVRFKAHSGKYRSKTTIEALKAASHMSLTFWALYAALANGSTSVSVYLLVRAVEESEHPDTTELALRDVISVIIETGNYKQLQEALYNQKLQPLVEMAPTDAYRGAVKSGDVEKIRRLKMISFPNNVEGVGIEDYLDILEDYPISLDIVKELLLIENVPKPGTTVGCRYYSLLSFTACYFGDIELYNNNKQHIEGLTIDYCLVLAAVAHNREIFADLVRNKRISDSAKTTYMLKYEKGYKEVLDHIYAKNSKDEDDEHLFLQRLFVFSERFLDIWLALFVYLASPPSEREINIGFVKIMYKNSRYEELFVYIDALLSSGSPRKHTDEVFKRLHELVAASANFDFLELWEENTLAQ